MKMLGIRFPGSLAAIAILAVSAGVAQTDNQSVPVIKFSSHTSLVLVPAIVTDHSGHHLTGLKQEDFTILENGAEQKVATFEEITSDPGRLSHLADPNEYSNFLTGDSNARVTAIVLDLLNTPFAAQADARSELLKFLAQSADRREPTALYTLTRNGVQTVHDFTTDPRVLTAALRKLKGDASQMVDGAQTVQALTGTATPEGTAGVDPGAAAGPGGGATATPDPLDPQAVQTEFQKLQTMLSQDAELNFQTFQQRLAITYTLQGLQQIAQALAGVPGRKSLIWASGGFPFTVSGDTMYIAPIGRDSVSDVLPLYERTWQLLNSAQVSLYPVDVKGLDVVTIAPASVQRPGRNYGRNAGLHQMDTEATFNLFASMTGGRAYYNSNDLVKGFRDAVDDSAEYYMLGYYLDQSKSPKTGWRKLTVKVKGEHAQVRARAGFFVTNATFDAEASRGDDIISALQSPLDYTSLPLLMRWDKTEDGKEPGKRHVNYEIHVPPDSVLVDTTDNNHVALEFVAQARTPDGKDASPPTGQRVDLHPTPQNLSVIRKNGIGYVGALDLAPGEYTVRFVVRDNIGGRTGSVAASLTVQ